MKSLLRSFQVFTDLLLILFAPLVLVLTVGIFTWLPFCFLVICECLLSKSVPAHKVVGKLPLILSCAYKKFDSLILSPNFNISHYKEFTEYLKGLKLLILNALFCNFSIFETDRLLCFNNWINELNSNTLDDNVESNSVNCKYFIRRIQRPI